MDESRAYIHYLVPREREADLVGALEALEQVKGSLGVTDVQLSLTSLEEVFLTSECLRRTDLFVYTPLCCGLGVSTWWDVGPGVRYALRARVVMSCVMYKELDVTGQCCWRSGA